MKQPRKDVLREQLATWLVRHDDEIGSPPSWVQRGPAEDSGMKLCIDCKHCAPVVTYYPSPFSGVGFSTDYRNARCALTDVVCGNGDGGYLCSFERSDTGHCGPLAGNFEAKPLPEPKVEEPRRRRWWERKG